MPMYIIDATSVSSERYWVKADSPEAAEERLRNGEWDDYRDLGHDDMDIFNIEEAKD